MNKQEAINRLKALKDRGEPLIKNNRESQEFKKWHRDTEVAIQQIFQKETRHLHDFQKIRYSPVRNPRSTYDSRIEPAYQLGIQNALTVIDSFIDEIEEYWSKYESTLDAPELNPASKIELIIQRFHQVARKLRSRYSSRPTIEIEDEYDVQDLFHSLLKLFFDDVRAEEYTPSYAGANSKVDFLLKQERIVIEIKKTRKGLSAKAVGEQLIIDSQRYQTHPDCNRLICFVYDPEGRISNPRGLENDLTKEVNGIPVSVFITPH